MNARIALLATAVAAMPMAAIAQPVLGPYVSTGAGVGFPQDQTATPAPQLRSQRHWIFLDPGFSGQVSLGWGFGNGLRAEIEGDYANDHVRKVSSPAPTRAGGYEQRYGGFLNVLYDVDLRLPAHPYVGIGAGGQDLEVDHLNFSTPGFRFPSRGGSEAVGAFAYQAIVGFSEPLPWLRGLSFTAEYRFVGLLDPLPADREVRYSGLTGERIASGNNKLGNVYDHQILLGLRYAFGSGHAAAPIVGPVAAPAPAASRSYLVFFDWDRATLSDRARQIVADAAQASTRVRTTRIAVDGYADRSGAARYNQGLSERRAESVAAQLVQDGVPRQDIAIRAFGETHPLVATADGMREPQNRRVEIVLE